jgi:LuxR family transcriptional regulator, positive regulator of biofilm formation
MTEENLVPLAGQKIYILGPRSMQNQLLASFLAKRTGAVCAAGKTMESSFPNGAERGIVLWDCQGRSSRSVLSEMQHLPLDSHMVLIINLGQAGAIEKDAVEKGVRGIIYEHESFDVLPRAIQAVHNGELWLSREIMSDWIMSAKREGENRNGKTRLTLREVQILRLIAEGASNKRVAEKLLIQPNTVKTHIYNIFKKIDTSNRLQAALWARQNL